MLLLQPIAVTGTKEGLTSPQRGSLFRASVAITKLCPNSRMSLHHGDCIGADAEMHDIAKELGWHVEIHPPILNKYRALCKDADIIHAEYDYLTRNRHLVDAAPILFSCPKEMHEELRSGTWAATRYARKKHKKIYTFWPDGKVDLHHF